MNCRITKLLFIFFLLPVAVFCQTLTGKVVGIADGDTFTLLLDGKDSTVRIRMYGIDCPEKSQDYGHAAKKFASDLMFKRYVTVEQKDIDRYGRIVGMVYVGNNNINEAIIRAGYAWHFVAFDRNNPEWDKLEAQAREEKIGLWAKQYPLQPWEYRKKECALFKF